MSDRNNNAYIKTCTRHCLRLATSEAQTKKQWQTSLNGYHGVNRAWTLRSLNGHTSQIIIYVIMTSRYNNYLRITYAAVDFGDSPKTTTYTNWCTVVARSAAGRGAGNVWIRRRRKFELETMQCVYSKRSLKKTQRVY